MTTTISVSEAREKFAELTNRVQYGNERIDIQKHGKTVAVMITPEQAVVLERLEDMALGEMASERLADFDEARDGIPWEEVKAGL